MKIHSVGFPRMRKEAGERRVFLPEFIQFLAEMGLKVVLEDGYGSRSGFTFDDYQQGHINIVRGSREEAFQQDLVIVLRSPKEEEFSLLRRGAILFSMLHYPTRPNRVKLLRELGIRAISMDSVVDDNNERLVENMRAVAWNGLEVAFDVLEKRWPGLKKPGDQPIVVLILGAGAVGKHAVEAATKLGNVERNEEHIRAGGPGAVAWVVGRSITRQPEQMRHLMGLADMLVDATQRRDTSRPVIPNAWIGWLPEHAVVVDLAVDPYLPQANPPVVRGIEGIPQGNLDKYVFYPEDPDWTFTIPEGVPTEQRRVTVTCYSWPGIHPEACMRHYAKQLQPLLEVLVEKGYEGLSPHGGYFERALYRATLDGWLRAAGGEI